MGRNSEGFRNLRFSSLCLRVSVVNDFEFPEGLAYN